LGERFLYKAHKLTKVSFFIMPSQKNINKVTELKEKFARARAIAFTDYRGLSVAQVQNLKIKLREFDAELTVAKNSLTGIALKKANYKDGDELKATMSGPTATLFCFGDEVGPIKAVFDYSKENALSAGKEELPKFKAGFLGKDFLNSGKLKELAQLPGKNELQAKLVATINGPIYGIVNVMAGNLRKLVYVLKAVKKAKE